MRLALLVFAAVVLVQAVAAQTALVPGHSDLAAPPPQAFQFERREAGDPPQLIDFWEADETLAGDRLVLTNRTTASLDVPGRVTTTVVTWPGLVPVSRVMTGTGESYDVTFADGRIRGPRRFGNLSETVDAPLPDSVFAEGAEMRIVRSLPFREGYEATFRTVGAYGGVATDSVRVGSRVVVTLTGGTSVAAWPVRLREGRAPAFTYLVDAETRALLSVSYEFAPGRVMEMLPALPPPTGDVLRPGSPRLDLSWLGDETAVYTIRVTEPVQRDIGTLSVTRRVAGGVATLETRRFMAEGVGGSETLMTATADAATLAPGTSTTRNDHFETALTFTPGTVAGTRGPAGGPPDTLAVALAAPVFDAAWDAELARSLPLTDGTVFTAAVYGAVHGRRTVVYRVARGDGGTWTVASVGLEIPMVYTLDAEHHIVAMQTSSPSGAVVEFVRQP